MLKSIIYIIFAVIFILAYLRYFEHNSLYAPAKDIEFFPDEIGLSYEDIYLDTDDGARINAWLIPGDNARFTLLFCHGNAGNISTRMEKMLMLNKLGLDIFIFDYRGYGKSSGMPSEKGLYKDAQAAYDYLVSGRNLSPDSIIIYGESLGGAVAIDLAGKKSAKALIIESTFTSSEDVAKLIYPFFPAFLIWSRFDSITKIKKIAIPKLIIHSRNDELIPFEQSIELFKVSPEPKRHLELTGDHGSSHMYSKDLYVSGIRDFLKDL